MSNRMCDCWSIDEQGLLHVPPPCPKVSTQWKKMSDSAGVDHVFPMDDLRPHLPKNCWCRPIDDDGVLVHNALDRREDYEYGRLIPS